MEDEKEMKKERRRFLLVSLMLLGLIALILSLNVLSATYQRSFVGYTNNPTYQSQFGDAAFPFFNQEMCKPGQDFVLQIDPKGCVPSTVRSDLLEDQNVPIFCPIVATQINPLINVNSVDSIQLLPNNLPPEVAGIGYQPARAALGSFNKDLNVNNPVFNELGYAVIVLKQQKNESALTNCRDAKLFGLNAGEVCWVEGNITARLRYDIKNSFGVGKATFYLPETSDEEWNQDFVRYGFWDGKAFLRAESITDDSAKISVYSGRETVSSGNPEDKVKISTVTLKEDGPESKSSGLNIPGFGFCFGTMDLQLKGLENPDTRARIQVNGDLTEAPDGEKFLENKCKVRDIDKKGVAEIAKISCSTDEGSENIQLIKSPRIQISLDGVKKDYGIGDKLYETSDGKSVYLGYVSTKHGTGNEADLYARFIATPSYHGNNLTESMLAEVSRFDNEDTDARETNLLGPASQFAAGKVTDAGQWIERFAHYLGSGSRISNVTSINQENNFFGEKILISGFSSPRDSELSFDVRLNYESAMKDYQDIFEGFSNEKDPETGKDLGQQALESEIKLSVSLGQKRTALEICGTFEENYPLIKTPAECSDLAELSSDSVSVKDIVVNGKVYRLALDDIVEPSREEYSAEISISGSNVKKGCTGGTLGNDNELCFSDSESIKLVNLGDDYAEFDVSSVEETPGKEFFWKANNLKIKEGDFAVIGKNQYRITLNKINLKKLAKVSVNPRINNANSNATFNFKIGVEKRGIKLSPEKTQEKIDSLNKTINKWQGINDNLGKVVQAEKAACFVTQGVLTAKNFLSNLGGEGIARQKVMRGDEGWFDKCDTLYRAGQYSSVDECLSKNSGEIDSAVEAYKNQMSKQDGVFNELEKDITNSGGLLGEDVVDTDALMQKFVTSGYKTELQNSLNNQFDENKIKIGNEDVDVSTIVNSITPSNILLSQAKNLQLNARVLASNVNESTKEIARAQIKSDLGNFYVNSRAGIKTKEVADIIGVNSDDVNFVPIEGSTELPYKGLTYADISSKVTLSGIASSAPVAVVLTSDGRTFYAVLGKNGDDYPVVELYDSKGQKSAEKLNLYFKYYDSGSYVNPYKNYAASFYETGEYKGLPAVIPFDTENGWYAAVKSTLPVGGSIQAYDKSGRVSSFWLCNVGENGKEEFFSGIGDDKCQQMNLASGQTYSVFSGLDASKASQLVSCAVDAIESASTQRQRVGAGLSKIKIDTSCAKGFTADVREPATNVPDIQCQDFMSPTDCNILFNVCDPVICPSSRCDFGGTFPVADVVQSGVVGSLALCLPNFGNPLDGGVAIPVCLSGLYAGVDSYLTVLDSYQQCLKTSLETGQTVGVCDEIYSVYTCDFFWRQAVPLVDYLAPKVTGKVLGQDVRGGGEYLSAKDAFDKSGQSVDYFTQYYAENSFQAFKLRSTEDIGTAVCGNWLSVSVPNGGGLFDSLTTPDSPPQFYGRFDEISYSTTTNPPTSQYKVFYHIYAGKDFPANYQVYLRGSGSSFYQDTLYRRIVAQGFVPAGQYATDTPDFLAPSGYDQLCIAVNGQEECGFKQVTTDAGLNYLTDKAVASQASQTDITSESECVSGSVNAYSLLNPNLQAGVENTIDPAIYNQGITRICATDNPGKGTDAKAGSEDSRWVDVGFCGNEKVRCWLDTVSVSDAIKSTSIEDKTLSVVEGDYVDKILSQGSYLSQGDFSKLSNDIKNDDSPENRIKVINQNIRSVFLNQQIAYLTFLRGDAYAEIAKRLFDKITITIGEPEVIAAQKLEETQQPSEKPSESIVENPVRCEDCGDGFFNLCSAAECSYVSEQTSLECHFTKGRISGTCSFVDRKEVEPQPVSKLSLSCSDLDDCRKVLGNEIGKLAIEFKNEKGISDAQVKADTGVKSFECLALLVANQESRIQQCGSQVGREFEEGGNPLYCEGDNSKVLGGDASQGGSFGVMQINNNAHPDAFPEVYSFEENINYGLNLLFSGYLEENKVYNCYRPEALKTSEVRASDFQSVTYSGWQAALRNYNGWNTLCWCVKGDEGRCTQTNIGVKLEVGNPRYVEEVLGEKNRKLLTAPNMFPECV